MQASNVSARDAGSAVLEGGDEFGRGPLKISMFLDVAAQDRGISINLHLRMIGVLFSLLAHLFREFVRSSASASILDQRSS